MLTKRLSKDERPVFPKRAVVTAGMPYGNKELHFGHVGGMMIHADVFARFLRDRIGKDNVIFVSGTDCYGSPILESYRKLVEAKKFDGSLKDYVTGNHLKQKATLEKYEISPNLFGASALGRTGEVHNEVSKRVFNTLYDNGYLAKMSTPQFYDPECNVFLNGRQVIGKCPIQGCTSEKGYADECSLGHQYMPDELIDPKSALSGKTPVIKDVTNWYFKLDDYCDKLLERNNYLMRYSNCRKNMLKTIAEFLKKPVIYVQRKNIEDLDELESLFPEHETIDEEKKSSITFVFKDLAARDKAREVLGNKGINYRSGKTLVPFRLSGNVEWGVPVPDKEDQKDLTFWVWPESLWAPISFTEAYLEGHKELDQNIDDWWNNDDSTVFQFIGEDNIYFYGIAEMAMFSALQGNDDMENINLPHIISNKHILFMGVKASSSSEVKPPMADELLSHYTAEQLRMHFLSLGLSSKSASFKPQIYMNEEEKQGADPVLKEGNLLTNVYNRIVRSCFYTAQKHFDNKIPVGTVSEKILEDSKKAVLEYERHMYNHEFHAITYVLDSYIRNMNKYWAKNSRDAEKNNDEELLKQTVIDEFYALRVIATLLHPIAPTGCEMVREYLNASEKMWSWDYIFNPVYDFIEDKNYELKFLEPRVDFFTKHPSQLQFDEK